MWPSVEHAHKMTISGEAAVGSLYGEALRRWTPKLTAAVLPSLTAATLPPDPSGAEDTSDEWESIAEVVVLGGASLLWAATAIAALRGMSLPVPDPVEDYPSRVDPFALSTVAESLDMSEADVRDSSARVAADAGLTASMTDRIDSMRTDTNKVPGVMFLKLQSVLAGAPQTSDTAALRATVEMSLSPGSVTMEDIEEWSIAHSGALLNDAIVTAGKTDPESNRMEKVWISTRDSRTRRSHVRAHAQRAPLGGSFTVGSDRLDYPCDPSGSPEEVANCRCRVTILAGDEELPGRMSNNVDALAASGQEITMDENSAFRTFTDAVIAFTGTPTSDGRMLAADIELSFRSFPLPLMWCKQSTEGHLDSFTVGVIESATVDKGTVRASGYMLNTVEANEAADQIAHGVTGPSVDLAAAEWILTDVNGVETADESGDLYQTITKAELIGTTLVATPAFGDTTLSLNSERESRDVALVASAAEEFRPRVYDHRLFENPNLTGPTLPTMGDDGRIYGHLACFGQCHRSIQSDCVVVPRSTAQYAHFHTSPALRLDTGERLPVGRLTVGTGHAPDRMAGRPAAAHYDNTGHCFALVRVGEDKHGIWFSGIAAPWATPEQVEMGLSAPLSGDWRDFGSGLELVAALAVNTPGFMARGRSDDQGRPLALVASLGPVETSTDQVTQLSVDEIKVAVREAINDANADEERRRLSAESESLLERAAQITTPPTPAQEIAALLEARNYPSRY
jgi:hypothetical protein